LIPIEGELTQNKKLIFLSAFAVLALSIPVQATDLSVTKVARTNLGETLLEAAPGTEFFYEITIQDSQESVEGINGFLTDLVPSELSVIRVDGDRGLCAVDLQTVTCDFGAIADGETIQVFITVRLNEGVAAGTSISNTATVTADNEINPTDNQSTVEFLVGDETIVDPATASSGGCSLNPGRFKRGAWDTLLRRARN
jgi:hypothetical protein